MLQLIVTPVSLAMTFYGSRLVIPVIVCAASGFGVFLVFHFAANQTLIPGLVIDCQPKLIVSAIFAVLAAVTAVSFLRFGLFCLGTIAAGAGFYMLFDAFPILDMGVNYVHEHTNTAITESDLSTVAWIITICIAVSFGFMLQKYERVSFELLTSVLGGIGCGYSLHTFVIMQGGLLSRYLVFFISTVVTIIGWKFQRAQRFKLDEGYMKKNDDHYEKINNSQHTLKIDNNNNNAPPSQFPQFPYQYFGGMPMMPQLPLFAPHTQNQQQQVDGKEEILSLLGNIQSKMNTSAKDDNVSSNAEAIQMTVLANNLNSFMANAEKAEKERSEELRKLREEQAKAAKLLAEAKKEKEEERARAAKLLAEAKKEKDME